MAVTDFQSELEAFRQLIEDRWTDCRVIWPNEHADPPDPLDEKDPSYPARFLGVSIDYFPSDRVTYGGTNEIRGQLVISRWVQRGASDERQRDLAKKLKDMVDQFGDVAGLTFTGRFIESSPVEEEEFPFMGRAIAFEFVRFQEAIA